LRRLNQAGIKFDVFALSCIGAWVGVVYNQFDKDEDLKKTEEFFRSRIFRDDTSYSRFPINSVFGPDCFGNWKALVKFIGDPASYENLFLPRAMLDAVRETASVLTDHNKWNQGDFNHLMLELLAANPFARYFTSMMYLSEIDGLTRLYYPKSSFLKEIDFGRLSNIEPFIYHNAWNLDRKEIRQFANRPGKINKKEKLEVYEHSDYMDLTAQSLCACSALPFVEQTVNIDGDTYCEGALIDTVNFKRLLDDFPDLDEIWISRIVDEQQIRPPRNLHDALANLCQLFAATVGEDDVKLFKFHIKERGWTGKIREIEVSSGINYQWNHSNFDRSIKLGEEAVGRTLKKIEAEQGKSKADDQEDAPGYAKKRSELDRRIDPGRQTRGRTGKSGDTT
jgi:predicted acylesterase/phospholipase RssA